MPLESRIEKRITVRAMIGVPIDIDRPDEEVMADVKRVWEVCRKVEMGVAPEGELKEAIRRLREGKTAAPAAAPA